VVTKGVAVRVVLVLVFLVHSAHAQAITAPCSDAEVTELREHLAAQSDKAETWNLAWRLIFTGAAVGTAVVGYLDPFPSLQHGLYGSAGKATIGALARWVLPLHIHVPAATGDACTDLAALRKEVKRVAKKEKQNFWLGHIGGIAVNLGGAAYVYYYDGIGKALLSIAIGYPVGVTSNYTMPRATWKLYRSRESQWKPATATVTVLPTEHGWQAALVGTF
jgi:hypothetical protein